MPHSLRIWLAFFVLAAPSLARAQWMPIPDILAQPLIGEVHSRGERVPQANLDVIIDENAAHVKTDAQGRFVLEGLTTGRHVVHFRGQRHHAATIARSGCASACRR